MLLQKSYTTVISRYAGKNAVGRQLWNAFCATDDNGNPWSPGWFTLNFKTCFNISNRVELTAGVENILDLRYRPYSSGIATPGRNFIFSARVRI